MAGLRLTKAERRMIRGWLEAVAEQSEIPAERKLAAGVLAKMERLEMVAGMPRTGLTVPQAMEAFKGVLGTRLLLPPNSAAGVYAQMKRRLTALGLTRGDCVAVAKSADVRWPRGAIRAESLVRQADSLLSEAQQELPGVRVCNDLEDL